jgi:DNA-nicking Smr family endonuclease
VSRKQSPFNNPFTAVGKTLKKELEAREVEAKRPPPPPPKKPAEEPTRSDEQTFFDAMRDIRPIHGDARGRAENPPPPEATDIPVYDEEAEAFAELVSLVEGDGTFDIADGDEFIEGAAHGVDRRILQRLKRGDYAVRAHLDLHGLTREPAREAVDQFMIKCRRDGHRCVLIVTGRGLNSKDKIPVLKGLVQNWLERGRIGRSVLAFCTARPHDGGAGAVYVLLRR